MKKVYETNDIYVGMKLKCVKKDVDQDWWDFNRVYEVNSELCIVDDEGDTRDVMNIVDYLNDTSLSGIIFEELKEKEECESLEELYTQLGRLESEKINVLRKIKEIQ